ncbi:MAG TPA: hypothetical protein VE842_02875 [Pyrinomonadaceae bacterium]|jgi:hypothetical protein|nr:hypothetical protein [Pyrinomonadaceae bacterium]
MKPFQRPLPLIVLALILMVCGIALAASRTVSSSPAPAAVVGCTEDCKEKLDKMLEKCAQIPEARQGVCRDAANAHYDKCVEKCGERAR